MLLAAGLSSFEKGDSGHLRLLGDNSSHHDMQDTATIFAQLDKLAISIEKNIRDVCPEH